MKKKRGIPKEVVDKLDIRKKEKIKPIEVTVIVEEHQAKIPIPKQIRLELDLKKGQKCKVEYNKNKKEIICKF